MNCILPCSLLFIESELKQLLEATKTKKINKAQVLQVGLFKKREGKT